MLISRRQCLSMAAALAAETPAVRIARLIREYEQQGFHRTGTTVDRASGDWLYRQVHEAGLKPAREPFSLSRVDPVTNVLVAGGRRVEGIALFDGAFTGAAGIRGRLGAEIGIEETGVNLSATGRLGDARRSGRYKAIVAITRGGKPGLCPSNADSFLQPSGPPVLQVSSDEAVWLDQQRGAEVQLIAEGKRTHATAINVTARIDGTKPGLPPLVVMTPRSGWYTCASERGGGIACWLEIMRALHQKPRRRTVLFVASSGHEVGYLGIHAFIARRPGIVKKSLGWFHLGANIGAAVDASNGVQSSDDDLESRLIAAMKSAGLTVDRRAPRGAEPRGEAAVVHNAGGRYVSAIGGNALFHNQADRGPEVIHAGVIVNFAIAFTAVAKEME